jgi:1-deoxyxylulose-5-phosphate synthase
VPARGAATRRLPLPGPGRFVSIQNHYNLLAREEEREMIPLCLDEGVGTIIWSPLGRGRLARPREAAKLSVFASVASVQAARAMDTDDR